jgi:hypothetical protein
MPAEMICAVENFLVAVAEIVCCVEVTHAIVLVREGKCSESLVAQATLVERGCFCGKDH